MAQDESAHGRASARGFVALLACRPAEDGDAPRATDAATADRVAIEALKLIVSKAEETSVEWVVSPIFQYEGRRYRRAVDGVQRLR